MDSLFLCFATFAGNGAVANVFAIEAAFPIDLCRQFVSLLLGRVNAGTHGSGAQHPTASGYDLTVVERSTGVEDFAFQCRRCFQAVDRHTLGVVTRIAASCQHDTDAWARVPLCFDLVQGLRQGGFDQQHQTRLQTQHDRLGLRVAETAVEFDDFWVTSFVYHQAGIQETGVDIAFFGHATHGRPDHQVHDPLMHIGCNHGGRGVSTHAARVRTSVAVADAFVVLAGGHRQYVLAVDHHDEAGFFAVEEFLDDHARTGITKCVAGEHVAHRVFGFLQGHRHDHAFTGGQAVGLDDDRCTFFTQVRQGRLDLGEVLVVGRRDLVAGQKIFGEGFRAFQLGCAGSRTEAVQATAAEQVDDASHQRHFRTDDGQGHILLGEISQLLKGQHVDGDVFALGFNGGAGVAGGDEYFLDARVLGNFPGQGVFTATAANDQNIHFKNLG